MIYQNIHTPLTTPTSSLENFTMDLINLKDWQEDLMWHEWKKEGEVNEWHHQGNVPPASGGLHDLHAEVVGHACCRAVLQTNTARLERTLVHLTNTMFLKAVSICFFIYVNDTLRDTCFWKTNKQKNSETCLCWEVW